jgi:hypothetical protein
VRIIQILLAPLAVAVNAVAAMAFAAVDIQITRVIPPKPALRGQMLDVQFEVTNSALPANSSGLILEVNVVQSGHSLPARVHAISPLLSPSPQGGISETQRFSLLSTLPPGLNVGPAALEISHEQSKASYKLDLAYAPSRPSLGRMYYSPNAGKTAQGEPTVLEIGKENDLFILPLTDPEDNEAAVVLTFKQQQVTREVVARIARVGEGSGYWSTRPYRALVQVPDDLSSGPASLEVRIRANGLLSEPSTDIVTLADASRATDNPRGVAPRIVDSRPTQIGLGQSVRLLVQSMRSLNPRPRDTMVIVSSPTRVQAIRPEVNSAVTSQAGPDSPAIIVARLDNLVPDSYKVQIFNPALGEVAGLSNVVAVEVVSEILPPELIDVRAATDQDLRMLKQLTPFAPKSAGTACATYDPNRRYMTLQTNNLDANSNYVSVLLETEGRTYKLIWDDYCTERGGTQVIRLPVDIKPGTVKVTIANRTKEGMSRPVTGSFVIDR